MQQIPKKIEELDSIENIFKELDRILNHSIDDEAELLKGICNKLEKYYGPVYVIYNSEKWVPLQTKDLSNEIRLYKYWINGFSSIVKDFRYRTYNERDFPNLYIVRHHHVQNFQYKQFPETAFRHLDEELNVRIEGITPAWFDPNTVAE